jgi:H+/Cl- antiporter ClcA
VRQDSRGIRQANVRSSLEDLSPRFWLVTIATGVAAGVGAIVMMALLHAVQHAAFAYHSGEYSTAVAMHSDLRRVVVLAVGGVVAGGGWWLMRRYLGGTGGSPTQAVWSGKAELSLTRTALSGALSEVVIGMGGSLGREAAPQHTGAAAGAWLGRRFGLPVEQRTLLIACGAGAGVGSVYNVPLAGALFACELYVGSITLRTIMPALVTSAIATAVGWIDLPIHPVYRVADLGFPSASLLVFSLVAGPALGVVAAGWIRLVAWANDRKPSGRMLLLAPPVAFTVLGLLAIEYPLLLGNGRDLAQFAFDGGGVASTLLILALLKPLVTSMCLRSGASGGLFTPTMSLGAVLGAAGGQGWALVWAGPHATAYAMVGATAMLAAGMQAPIAAVAFAIELTNTVNAAMVALLFGAAGAVLAVRRLEQRSIYSARLPARSAPDSSAPVHDNGPGDPAQARAGVATRSRA